MYGVSCSKSGEFEDLINLQTHKHSKTVVLEPLETEVEKYKEMHKKINSLHEFENINSMTFDDFLNNVLQTTEEEYMKMLRSNLNGPNVILKRKPSEVRVNPYMKVVLSAWKANHDLQFVLDPYACAMYIVSYISKSQKGTSALLDQAAKEAREGNLDLKRQVRHIGNYFTNSVETCAQEAAYLTLQLPLTKAIGKVVFINTSPDKRTFLLKKSSALEKLSPNSTNIESGIAIKRYSMRPKALENWCLADYVSQLETQFLRKRNESESDCEDDSTDEDSEIEESFESSGKINITLKTGIIIKQRNSFQVIRFQKIST